MPSPFPSRSGDSGGQAPSGKGNGRRGKGAATRQVVEIRPIPTGRMLAVYLLLCAALV